MPFDTLREPPVCASCGNKLPEERWLAWQCERCEALAATPWYTETEVAGAGDVAPLIRGKTPGASPRYSRPASAPQPPTLPDRTVEVVYGDS